MFTLRHVLGSLALCLVSSLFLAGAAFAQSGTISGTVTDAETGETLIGVNILIEGTTQGAVTNTEGYYVLLNVSPGTHMLRASYVGFSTQVIENVRVNIDQATTVDIEMSEQVLEGEEVLVTAERPVVQPDVSASQANITAESIERLPVSDVTEAIGLQAGIVGLSVRGSSADELNVMVNGLSFRDERDNTPFMGVSMAAVEEIQVQTGGFNAEYGNVRSGVINVVTKEGPRNSYDVDIIARYSPPSQKHFGPMANDPEAFWIRPFLDPDVAFVGTENGAWSEELRSQYPEFAGWIALSEERMRDDDPTNDMSPAALQQAFLWQKRKPMELVDPDYTVDAGFGGPVPLVSSYLGAARFYASYRRDQSMYLVPLSEDRFLDEMGHVKVTSDVAPGMKLSLEGLLSETTGTAESRFGQPGVFRSASGIAQELATPSYIDCRIFCTDYWAPTEIRRNMLGARFTHAVGQNTFYDIRFTRFASAYDTNPAGFRDTTAIVAFGGVGFDEGPFGFSPEPDFGVEGMRMGVGMSNARDSSRVVMYNLKADLTSQLNQFLQFKTGFEYNLTDSRVNYGQFDAFLRGGNSQSSWNREPVRGAVYGQGRLEFQGLVANLGVRLDYFRAGGDWYDYDLFTPAFASANAADRDSLLETTPTDHVFSASPRLGVSFPVTAFSKLYFNYGHFRSLPDPNDLFLFRETDETSQVTRVADPNMPLPKTRAYELGYEHSLLNQFLVRVAGYYKDISLEPRLVSVSSRDGQTNYSISRPNSYQDVRGFEVTLSRMRGTWLQGFINYTYMVDAFGYFGFDERNENPTIQRQFEESDVERRNAFTQPVPRPYARVNLDLLLPIDFGPSLGGLQPLGDWQLSFIGSWRDGGKYTWTGGGAIPGVRNNVDRTDSWNLDLRLTRSFQVSGSQIQVFADVFNALNVRRFSFTGFIDGEDQNAYLRSLHLPESDDYDNIPGDDQVGTYRDYDVSYQPMIGIGSRSEFVEGGLAPDEGTIYFESSSDEYIVFENGSWQNADPGRVEGVLDDKAYIDMPNMRFLTFLDPRNVYLGIRLSL
jgi:hypothetical protein